MIPSRLRRQQAISAAFGVELLEDRTVPATLTVTTLADAVVNDGQVSLREALTAANNDSTVDGATGSGADVIEFDASLFTPAGQQTITLGSTLTVSSELTINGPGAGELALDGGRAISDLGPSRGIRRPDGPRPDADRYQ